MLNLIKCKLFGYYNCHRDMVVSIVYISDPYVYGFQGVDGVPLDGEDNHDDGQDDATGEEHEYGSFMGVDLWSLTSDEVKGMEFASLNASYAFYNEYGKVKGFSVRKNKRGKNKNNEVSWQQFVCSCEGYRRDKYINMPNRQREHRVLTRFGCQAEMRVSIEGSSGCWFVSRFSDDHNHELVGERYYGLLRSHKKMSDADVAQMDSMRKSGIRIPQIYGSFANQSGGYQLIGFRKKEMYNEVQKERRLQEGDVKEAVCFLRQLKRKDPTLYWGHKVGGDGRLLHLFWSDGCCQVDYEVFGDVLAFDATYGRNKYKCPVVVFSGVNHHKQTCVFGCAIVSNEKEETYVWVLEQFLHAMKGRQPTCVITDGDLSMKNAISAVFPNAHHRLCGWHLIRNVTANVGDIRFTKMFKTCMLANLDIDEFEDRWKAAVEECRLTENEWVQQLYDKKLMWATAHIRGKFFAGMRTTSRCEALHAHMGRYVHSGFSLNEFLHHYQRCLEYMRSREIEADFKSAYGVPVMQTEVVSLERFGSLVYTREIFKVFRKRMSKSLSLNVVECIETTTSNLFVVVKYGNRKLKWHVALYTNEREVRCSCLGMESDGIPCGHIIRVLVFLDFDNLPESLVLDRWTKNAKDGVQSGVVNCTIGGDNALCNARYTALIDSCRRLCTYASRDQRLYKDIREKLIFEIEKIEDQQRQQASVHYGIGEEDVEGYVREPEAFTSHTSGGIPSSSGQRGKKKTKCGCCKAEGHTRKSCPHAARIDNIINSQGGSRASTPFNYNY